MKIEIIEVNDDKNVRFHVMPGNNMLCSVAGTDLYPTPAWLCRQVAIETARRQLQTQQPNPVVAGCAVPMTNAPSEDQLCTAGFHMLHEAMPVVLDISFEMLHSREERPS
ncbi:hypothetical protein LCGC14_0823640 [marine sediment metagenome]|uniref:Uncharacterized protein n=1 Tax=marine sediment metagenome TaxID=412755 RepID=A0A0F9S2Y9_9ZZZZ